MTSSNGILLAGDPVTDICLMKLPPRGGHAGSNPGFAVWTEKGGVDLTDRTLKALGFATDLHRIDRPSGKVFHSLVTLSALKSDNGKEVFDTAPARGKPARVRVSGFEGYFEGDEAFVLPKDQTGPPRPDEVRAVLLNDAGGGMRASGEVAKRIKGAKDTARIFIHKMHPPLDEESVLRKTLASLKECNSLLIVSASDLRLEGVRLRGHLSWDATLEDLTSALADSGSLLSRLRGEYSNVLVQFDVEAVALLRSNDTTITFVFHPTSAEGDLSHERPGSLYGQMNAFACALVAALPAADWTLGVDPLKRALAAARVYAVGAIIVPAVDGSKPLGWPGIDINQRTPGKKAPETDAQKRFAEFGALRDVTLESRSVNHGFRLISYLEGGNIKKLAREIVKQGRPKLDTLPSARIGHFATVDRTEIESYRTVQRLIDRYLLDESVSKPISIGVFGPPGAGKSFGIKEIVRERQIPFFEFNMSEAAEEALPGYFHELRDIRLRGETPLCFFDEFDSRGRALIARFLAPMQDGEFRDGAQTHPVGRAILVFAGGTAKAAFEFRDGGTEDPGGNVKPATAQETQKAKELKVPDFVSRLSATIDILGPNSSGVEDEKGHVLRRAVLLRNLLEKQLPQVVTDGKAGADIDEGVIDAFLFGGKYTFGARSIEQILKMCAVPLSQARLGVSDLPDASLLQLHLEDAECFLSQVKSGT